VKASILERVDVQALLDDAVGQMHAPARAKGIEVVMERDDGACPAETDSARLRQIVGHLLGNRVKFTERGTITARADREPAAFVVTIEDTGIGIDPRVPGADLGALLAGRASAGAARRRNGPGTERRPPPRAAPGRRHRGPQRPRPGEHVRRPAPGGVNSKCGSA
jgi:light-regulated signal transduction histidine kinase (bacteriophytochrome)